MDRMRVRAAGVVCGGEKVVHSIAPTVSTVSTVPRSCGGPTRLGFYERQSQWDFSPRAKSASHGRLFTSFLSAL